MCINNEEYPLKLTVHKIYKVIPGVDDEEVDTISIVDDSGEDYLYSVSCFVPVQLTEEGKHSFNLEAA